MKQKSRFSKKQVFGPREHTQLWLQIFHDITVEY